MLSFLCLKFILINDHKLQFICEFICTFLFASKEKYEKKRRTGDRELVSLSCHQLQESNQRTAARGQGRVLRIKKRTCRIFIRRDSPSPMSPNPACPWGKCYFLSFVYHRISSLDSS